MLAPSDGEIEIMYFGLESLRMLSLEGESSGRPEGKGNRVLTFNISRALEGKQ